jgi:hypothetical protein
MTDRCKIGDIAIIIRDEIGCEENIGRMMHVMGPRQASNTRGTLWQIKPVVGTTMTYLEKDGSVGIGVATDIEHRDKWLLPIRPEAQAHEIDEIRELVLPPTETEGA